MSKIKFDEAKFIERYGVPDVEGVDEWVITYELPGYGDYYLSLSGLWVKCNGCIIANRAIARPISKVDAVAPVLETDDA